MLAILSSRIFTGDPRRPWAEALLVKNSRIIAVGSNIDIESQLEANTRTLLLPGRLITPGLVDGHCHFVNQGILLQRVDLRGVPSLKECRKKIHQAVKSIPPGEWIIGRGWDENRWPVPREPDCRDLDDLAPDHPVMMTRVCGHSIWVNSKALALANINQNTPDPSGGKIGRNPSTNQPTGIIYEAVDCITKHIPELTADKMEAAAKASQQEALSYGITSVHSCEGLKEWKTLTALKKEGELKLRVYHLLHPEDLQSAATSGVRLSGCKGRLWFNHVKLYADGSLGAGTALLHEPYCDDSNNFGVPFLTQTQLQKNIEMAYRRNLDVAIHAIGDKAVTNSLMAIRNARQHYPGHHRDRIEHVQLIRPSDIKWFLNFGITASVQPIFLPTDMDIAIQKWGGHRCRYAYAWKKIKDMGVSLQLGSDSPVEPINPLLGMQVEVQRKQVLNKKKYQWFSSDNLTLSECLAGFTRQSAWTSGMESDLGFIAPGMLADLTVFNRDLFNTPVSAWGDVGVDLTMINGNIVFQNDTGI